MDEPTARMAVMVGVPVLAGLVWLLRLEGRVNTHDALLEALKDDVSYIRSRIDHALNGHDRG